MDYKFVEFIKEFLKNYEKNYKLCKEWVDEVHTIILDKINNENSFLDIIIGGLEYKLPILNKNII